MQKYKLLILLATLLLADPFQPQSAAREISAELETDRDNIYLGESFQLTLKVKGTNRKLNPDLSQIKDCRVEFMGASDRSRSWMERVNGKVRQFSETHTSYLYRLTPESAGKFRAGPVYLPVNGRTIKKAGPVIKVTGVEKQDSVFIDISASRQSALVVDPFTVTLKIGVKQLPPPFSSEQPLVPSSPPSLKIPFLDLDPIQGLQNPDIRSILEDMLVRSPRKHGFNINGFEMDRGLSRFPFGFQDNPFERHKAKFAFKRQTVEKDGTNYLEYYLTLEYHPEDEGAYTFGPVTFKGTIISGVTDDREAITKEIFAVGPAVTVRVVPPPLEDRPEHYIGALGSNMTVEAEIDSQNCNVGDPLKLTVTIAGDIRLKNTYAPELDDVPELQDNFKVYSDTVETRSRQDSRQFVYTIRPIRAGTLEIPPLEFAYFDSSLREYRSARTDPIPVRARKSTQLTTNIVIAAAADDAPTEDDFAIPAPVAIGGPSAFNTNPWGAEWQSWLLAFPPLLFFSLVIAQKTAPFFSGLQSSRKKRLIAPAAVRAMKEEFYRSNEPGLKARAIAAGLLRYAARRSGNADETPIPAEAAALLKKQGIPGNLAEEWLDIAQRNFDIAYSPDPEFNTQQLDNDLVAATALIPRIENCLYKKKKIKQ